MNITKLGDQLKNLSFLNDENKKRFMVDSICPICSDKTHIKDFCIKCEERKEKKERARKSLLSFLYGLDDEFINKYGINFSINDFKSENNNQKKVKDIVIKYIHAIKKYSEEPECLIKTKGLIFAGNQGTGKSMLSNLIQFESSKKGFISYRISQWEMYQSILRDDKKLLNDFISPDFLFIDEVGRINKTDNLFHVFFNIINKRYMANKQTIFTTNLVDDIDLFIDSDRMKEFTKILFDWNSYRGKKNKRRYD